MRRNVENYLYEYIGILVQHIQQRMANCSGDSSLGAVRCCGSVDLLKEYSKDYKPVETFEQKDEVECGQKRKRRKRRMLTGVSRQRRAANARERSRIQGVNRAFVNLKNSLPLPHVDISKIEILRLAMKWIDHLGTLLKDFDERKDLLNMKQMETSRHNEFINTTGEECATVKHDCLYHQFPDLKNTLWEECIGLQGKLFYCSKQTQLSHVVIKQNACMLLLYTLYAIIVLLYCR